jgi:hypothetical protein
MWYSFSFFGKSPGCQPTQRRLARKLRVERLEDRALLAYDFGYALGLGSAGIDVGLAVAADSAGNVAVVGNFTNGSIDLDPGLGSYVLPNAGASDGFAASYDPLGNLRWGVHFASAGSNNATEVAMDRAGNTFVYGSFTGTIQVGASGATPLTLTAAAGGSDACLAKIDPAGNLLWARTLGEGGVRRLANGIATDSAGNVYLTGDLEGTKHMFVAGYDNSTGATAWSRVVSGGTGINRLGYITYASGIDVAVDATGNVYATGRYMGTIDFNPNPTQTNSLSNSGTSKKVLNVEADVFVLKLNAAGNYLWAGSLGGRGLDVPAQMATDGLGNVYVSGSFGDAGRPSYIDADPGPATLSMPPGGFLVKLDPSRNLIWGRSAAADGLEVDAVGNVYATSPFSGTIDADPGPGVFNLTSAGSNDIIVRKLDSAGNFVWAGAMGGPGFESPRAVAIDGQGTIFTVGAFRGTVDFDPGVGTYSLIATPDGNANLFSDAFVSKLVPSSSATSTAAATDNALMHFLTEELLTTRKRK